MNKCLYMQGKPEYVKAVKKRSFRAVRFFKIFFFLGGGGGGWRECDDVALQTTAASVNG